MAEDNLKQPEPDLDPILQARLRAWIEAEPELARLYADTYYLRGASVGLNLERNAQPSGLRVGAALAQPLVQQRAAVAEAHDGHIWRQWGVRGGEWLAVRPYQAVTGRWGDWHRSVVAADLALPCHLVAITDHDASPITRPSLARPASSASPEPTRKYTRAQAVLNAASALDARGYVTFGSTLYIDTGPADVANGPDDSGGNGGEQIPVLDAVGGDHALLEALPLVLTGPAVIRELLAEIINLAGQRAPQRGVDFRCEGCGALEGSRFHEGWYRCKRCGYPSK